jgi:DNA-binding HxlR family transcriptional regulator
LDVFELLALRGTRKILKALAANNQMKYSDLVKRVGYSTTTSRALKSMEEQGLVQKKALTEPYRPVAYWLTDKGKKVSEAAEFLESIR